MERTITFDMCTSDHRGTVHFSEEGYDILQAIVMRWIIHAENGETAAKELTGGKMDGYAINQVGYWKAAKTFLLGKLCGQMKPRMNLRSTLAEIARWKETDTIPGRWHEAIKESQSEGTPDGVLDPTSCGSGGGGNGGDGADTLDTGHSRQVAEEPGESDAPGLNQDASRVPDGKATDAQGTRRVGKNNRRKLLRGSSGRTTRQHKGEIPEAE